MKATIHSNPRKREKNQNHPMYGYQLVIKGNT